MLITDFKQLESFRNKTGIYLFINKKDPTKHYAGKSNNIYRRIVLEHKNAVDTDHQYIDRIIRKYGLLEYFHIELIHWWDYPVDNLEVLALEAAVIDAYDCLKTKGGYNLLLFGNDTTGYKHTRKSKLKMQQSWKYKINNGWISHLKGRKMPETQKQKLRTPRICFQGDKHRDYDHTIYKFKNIITNEIFEGTRFHFRNKYNLEISSVARLVLKQLKSYKNWIMADSSPEFLKHEAKDKTIYKFKNLQTNEIFKGYREDFYKKYHLHRGGVCDLIHRKYKQHKNWILVENLKNQTESTIADTSSTILGGSSGKLVQ